MRGIGRDKPTFAQDSADLGRRVSSGRDAGVAEAGGTEAYVGRRGDRRFDGHGGGGGDGDAVARRDRTGAGVRVVVDGAGQVPSREAVLAAPFPAAWRSLLDKRVAFYGRLGPAGRVRFESDVAIFLAEQRFVGPQGAPVPEDTCVLVAAAAAMLGHGRPAWEWPTHREIIVHITNFNEHHEPGDHHAIAGMVHSHGPVVLSRKQVRRGFKKSDGENVAVHELAHVIDLADGTADGHASIWADMPGWEALVQARLKQVRRGKNAPLRAYAGTNEAELFAVAVEAFFETPEAAQTRPGPLSAARGAVQPRPVDRRAARGARRSERAQVGDQVGALVRREVGAGDVARDGRQAGRVEHLLERWDDAVVQVRRGVGDAQQRGRAVHAGAARAAAGERGVGADVLGGQWFAAAGRAVVAGRAVAAEHRVAAGDRGVGGGGGRRGLQRI
jgi:Mlc titration factor MtfA (ptsG expression regulator)